MVCAACSENKIVLSHLSQTKAVRVCISCYGSGVANMKQSESPPHSSILSCCLVLSSLSSFPFFPRPQPANTGRLAWLCDSDSDSDVEDLDAINAPVAEEVRFERYHRSGRVHGI